MSVVLIVRAAGADGELVVPIATQQVFDDVWVPAARVLGLEWVPAFAAGVPVGGEDVPAVLAELHRLAAAFAQRPPAAAVTERLAQLVGTLTALQEGGADFDAYIG
jgi:hypothetical protein